ncbi:MAG: hypothetical protein WEB93_05920 [Sphingomonadales bacterium]
MEISEVSTRQLKAARTLLGLSRSGLTKVSGVPEPEIESVEEADGDTDGLTDTKQKIKTALEAAGIEFIEENGGGLGVRLRYSTREKRQISKWESEGGAL